MVLLEYYHQTDLTEWSLTTSGWYWLFRVRVVTTNATVVTVRGDISVSDSLVIYVPNWDGSQMVLVDITWCS